MKLDRGLYSAIGRTIPSIRSKKKGHISHTYVQRVLEGEVTRDNETTREIWRKAKAIQEILNS